MPDKRGCGELDSGMETRGGCERRDGEFKGRAGKPDKHGWRRILSFSRHFSDTLGDSILEPAFALSVDRKAKSLYLSKYL